MSRRVLPGFRLSLSVTLAYVTLMVLIPLGACLYKASTLTADKFCNAVWTERTRAAYSFTFGASLASAVVSVVFGIAAAWAIARFKFPGRTLLTSIIDLPFSVSPVVAGLMLLLIFGRLGFLGPWLQAHGYKIVFAWPGLVLATMFVTLLFVVRELLPVMEAIGDEEEVAAVSLGANRWQLFWRVTLPNIKWGLLYGIILCNARAMGEFGAVRVVSGGIVGKTESMPLRVEKLFQDSDNAASFAVASALTLLALVTLAVKAMLERKSRRDLAEAAQLRTNAGEQS